ncbi:MULTISPECIES: class F sortase [unclassified Streptomyces]|uniref:class F sortase n=2 Tax=Streptomyces TaxID=1883 RepID=UPI0033BCEDD2
MGMPTAGGRKILGIAAALIGLTMSAILLLIATVWAQDPSSADDFGSPQPRTSPSADARPRSSPPKATDPARPSTRTGSPTASLPSRLSIPRIELQAPIDPVGVDRDGQMQVPEDPERVGWYRFSPAPGTGGGSSVVVGHIDSRGRGLGVLLGLTRVRSGDRVLVERKDGTVTTYEIIARKTVPKKVLAESGVFDRSGPAVLTLITCAGPYLPNQGGYQNNLVVTAAEVSK